MDNKKLIGTIVGVIGFVALIAGATFAWLTINANVTNASVNGTSRNFIITYAGSAQIGGNIPQIASGSATTAAITTAGSASVANDSWAAVSASKTANSAAAGSFKLMLHLDANNMTTNSIVYAVCKGACPTTAALATVSNGTATCASGVAACGLITAGATTPDVQLHNDTSTFNTDAAVSTTTYNIYFWANANTVADADMGKGIGGYIYATASQVNS